MVFLNLQEIKKFEKFIVKKNNLLVIGHFNVEMIKDAMIWIIWPEKVNQRTNLLQNS